MGMACFQALARSLVVFSDDRMCFDEILYAVGAVVEASLLCERQKLKKQVVLASNFCIAK
jgi:hypothetical protein